MKKRSVISWVLEFAGRKRVYFGGSVLLAMLGVAASFAPYLIITKWGKKYKFDENGRKY